jgi:hypothetical protein
MQQTIHEISDENIQRTNDNAKEISQILLLCYSVNKSRDNEN